MGFTAQVFVCDDDVHKLLDLLYWKAVFLMGVGVDLQDIAGFDLLFRGHILVKAVDQVGYFVYHLGFKDEPSLECDPRLYFICSYILIEEIPIHYIGLLKAKHPYLTTLED